jgi:hypothetical protein
MRLKEKWILHKFWGEFLRRRMIAETQKSAEIEAVFQKIKIATGIQDFGEIVNNYLAKDETTRNLVGEVVRSEARLDEL